MNGLYVFLGGGIGALLRYGVSYVVQKFPSTYFPIATLISNLTACLLVGFFTVLAMKMKTGSSDNFHAFWIIGICGGFSTFSTFAKENLDLMERGHIALAVLNILISIILCIGMVYFGRKIFG